MARSCLARDCACVLADARFAKQSVKTAPIVVRKSEEDQSLGDGVTGEREQVPKHEGLSAPGRPILEKGSVMLLQKVLGRRRERWRRSLRAPGSSIVVFIHESDLRTLEFSLKKQGPRLSITVPPGYRSTSR
jgi:hypothetical protein